MGTTGGSADGGRGRMGQAAIWLRDRPLRQLGVWLATFGLVLTAPFGGWADATKPGLKVATVDQTIQTGPIDVTIDRVSASTRPGKPFSALVDGQYLLAFGTVKSTQKTTLSHGELQQVVRLAGVDGLSRTTGAAAVLPTTESQRAEPTVYFAEDTTTMATLAPDLTYQVAWVWQRQGTEPPTDVDVVIQKLTWRLSSLQDIELWLDPTPTAHLKLPVTVKTAYVDPKATS